MYIATMGSRVIRLYVSHLADGEGTVVESYSQRPSIVQ